MTGYRRHRRVTLALLGAAVLLPGLSACASTVDSVKINDYVGKSPGAVYRVVNPVTTSNAPIAVPFPASCKSPSSRMGAPEGC